MPGAVEALRELTKIATVIVFTSRIAVGPEGPYPQRTPGEVQAEINFIREMLDSEGFQHVEIWTKPWKPGANAYVDDKAVHYSGRKHAWEHLVDKLSAMCEVS